MVPALVLTACSKSSVNSNINSTDFNAFVGKYLVCDSIVTTQNGIRTSQIVGKAGGSDMIYSSNGTFIIYSNPVDIKNYEFTAPDFVYYWNQGTSQNSSQFFLIISPK